MRSHHEVAAATALLVCLPFVAGCSETRTAAAAPTGPLTGGVLRMVQEVPSSLDPLEGDSVYESLPCNQLFDTLVALDSSLNLKPSLAETWNVSRDGREYTFNLRPEVRFHDGSKLSAADVVFTFQRILHPDRRNRSLAYPYLAVIDGAEEYSTGAVDTLTGVEALDPATVRIRLERAYPSFLEVLTMENSAIVPRALVLAIGEERFGRQPIGTGPFMLAEWGADQMRLVANTDYFAGRPHLDAVEIQFLRDDENDFGAERFFSGSLDMLEPPTEAIARLNRDPRVKTLRYQELSLAFLGLNTAEPPLDQLWMRQAIAHALDRQAMVADSPSVRREAGGILPPGLSGYSPEIKTLRYSPDDARRLLAEAGHPGGEGLPPIRLVNPSGGAAVTRIIEMIRDDLAAVGLRLEVTPVNWQEMSEVLERRDAPAFLLGWVADLSDPDAFLRALFQSGGMGNYFSLQDRRTDNLLAQGVAEQNPVDRARLYRQLEHHVLKQAPIVPLYHTLGVVAVHEHVHGFEPGPLGLAKLDLEHVWISAGLGS